MERSGIGLSTGLSRVVILSLVVWSVNGCCPPGMPPLMPPFENEFPEDSRLRV